MVLKIKHQNFSFCLILLIFSFSSFCLLFYLQYIDRYRIFVNPFESLQSFYYDYVENYFLEEKEKVNYFDKILKDSKNDSLKMYRVIHETIMNAKLPLKVSVNGHTYAGYANRLYSMISSLVIALITDSALIIRWKNINKHIHEPFLKTFHDFSNDKNEFNIDFNPNDVFHPKAIYGWLPTRNMDLLIQTSVSLNKSRFLYDDIEPYFFELCSNPRYYDKFYYYGLISRETLFKANEITYNMKHYLYNFTNEYKQDHILKVPFEVGGNLLNIMWKPKDHIMSRISHYVDKIFNGYFMIGIQLRYEYIKDPEDTYKFINCSYEIESMLRKKIKNFNLKYKGVKWFLTSDSADVVNRLIKEYQDKIIVGEGLIGHIEADHLSYTRTILDVELLSRCNELVITGGSTYGKLELNILENKLIGVNNDKKGFIGAMKMQKMPFYINGGQNMSKCVRMTLSKPSLTNTLAAVFKK